MANTTIQLSQGMKDRIASFGSKNDTYEIILSRIYSLAVKEQLRDFLMSSKECISLGEFKKEIEEEWPKSK